MLNSVGSPEVTQLPQLMEIWSWKGPDRLASPP